MEAPPHPSRVRELRLVVRREPFGHPARLILVREQARGAPEHTLQPVPQPARAVEVKHVGQLVRGHEPEPAVEEQEPVVTRGRRGEDGDPVGGRDGGETVGGVDVVRQGDVHYAAGRVQLRGEQPIGPLRLTRLYEGGVAVGGPEVDAEMGCVQGAPGA